MKPPIYLDYNATCPVAPEVLEAMLPALRDSWGNPSSAHAEGRQARSVLEDARERLAHLVGAERDEVLFTSGGTEANALAVAAKHGLHRLDHHFSRWC